MHAHLLVNFGVLIAYLILYKGMMVVIEVVGHGWSLSAKYQKIKASGDNRAENSLTSAYIIHTADVMNTPIVYIHHEKSRFVIHSLDNSFISHPPTRNGLLCGWMDVF
jgi:hypothetical protein